MQRENVVYFSGCFGWVHLDRGDTGVIICPTAGRDAHLSHVSLRTLAHQLGEAGYSTLRFDYPSTGDSSEAESSDIATAWMQALTGAIAYLREQGVCRVVLCGYRLGALLCLAEAAHHDDIVDVVMIDPVPSGAKFLRELGIMATLQATRTPGVDASCEVDGTSLHAGSASPLRALDPLTMLSRPAERVLILASAPSPAVANIASKMERLGLDVTRAAFQAIKEFGRDGCPAPPVDLGSIRDWLPRPTARMLSSPRGSSDLTTDGFVESPLHFGSGLFGILCRPRSQAHPRHVVLMGNCGVGPRFGPSRFHVFLARRLAAAGTASLRLDFAGLGDSAARDAATTHIYETDRTGDMRAAIDALWTQGYREFTTAGVCSGSYHAWRSALDDDRVNTVLMVNPAVFAWRQGQSLEALKVASRRKTTNYLTAARRSCAWKYLLSHRLDVRRELRAVGALISGSVCSLLRRVRPRTGKQIEDDTPLAAMRHLAARGARVLVVIGETDVGWEGFSACFGQNGRRLSEFPGSSVQVLPTLDHAVTRRRMQEQVAEAVVNYLSQPPREIGFGQYSGQHTAMPSRRQFEGIA